VIVVRSVAAFLTALQFLTRIPVPASTPWDGESLPRATAFFPLVGALVGAVGGLVLLGASSFWPRSIAAALAVVVIVLLTGAFHEDALADAADGFGAGGGRERMLEIMRDSRIGSYGAVALVLALALRIAALAAMDPRWGACALVAAHTLGRWTALPLIRWLPYARGHDTGTVKPFVASVTWGRLAFGSATAVGIAVLALGREAVPALLLALLLTLLAGRFCRARLGGMTGDCLGAANVVVELGCLVLLARLA
jgi:adenosylcobinamide-GDP ribazoletransferase